MKQDLKNSAFSFRKIKQRKRKRRVAVIMVLLLLVSLFLLVSLIINRGKYRRVQQALLAGRYTLAGEILSETGPSILFDKRRQTLMALLHLYQNRPETARDILDRIGHLPSPLPHGSFLDSFISRGDYQSARLYLASLAGDQPFYQAVLSSARMDHTSAAQNLARIDEKRLSDLKRKKIHILRSLTRDLETGSLPVIFDRNQMPLADYNTASRKIESRLPGFDFRPFSEQIKEKGLRFFSLTLDRNTQELIHLLFREYHGSFILLDLVDSSILAAYSKPLDPESGNTVFTQWEEPGSVIKLLTLFCYLNLGQQNLFPYQCDKPLRVDNRIFYDWMSHGKVNSPTDALARSCNLAFAKMALSAGRESLFTSFEKFLMNSAPLSDQFLTFRLGDFVEETDDYDFIRQAEGLSPLKSTVFYTALFTAAIARHGTLNEPYLIQAVKNIFKVPYYDHPPKLLELIDDNELVFLKIREAMETVVTHPRGTGRHSRVPFVKTAVKTGTTGSRPPGLDAVLVGYFPADQPKYAFGFKLKHAGRAELKGALFLKNFLRGFYNR